MPFIIGRPDTKGELYVEGIVNKQHKWTNDINLAKVFMMKNSAERHIIDYCLQSCYSIATITSRLNPKPRAREEDRMRTAKEYSGYLANHLIMMDNNVVALYVDYGKKYGNHAINAVAVADLRALGKKHSKPITIRLRVERNKKGYYELNPDELDIKSLRRGKSGRGDYWLHAVPRQQEMQFH